MADQVCTKCGRNLPHTIEYFQEYGNKGKLRKSCRECRSATARSNSKRRGSKPDLSKTHQVCSMCHVEYSYTSEFFAIRSGYLLHETCKTCSNQKAVTKWQRKTETERQIRLQREFELNNSDSKICTRCNKECPATLEYFYYCTHGWHKLTAQCRDCIKLYALERVRRNRDAINKCQKEARQEHIEKARQREREYNEAHREERNKYTKFWRDTYPERRKTAMRNAIAKRKGASGKHSEREVREQFDRQQGKCYYCQCSLGGYKEPTWHADHVVPLSRGGSNSIDNIVAACINCNLRKHNRLPHEWPIGGRLL